MNPQAYEWIRLKDDRKRTTITCKHKKGTGISDTEEIEVEVDDFKKAYEILSKLDSKRTYYQESKRILSSA